MTRKEEILLLHSQKVKGTEIARRLGLSKYQVYYVTNHQRRVGAIMRWRQANLKRYLAYHRPYEKEWWKKRSARLTPPR